MQRQTDQREAGSGRDQPGDGTGQEVAQDVALVDKWRDAGQVAKARVQGRAGQTARPSVESHAQPGHCAQGAEREIPGE